MGRKMETGNEGREEREQKEGEGEGGEERGRRRGEGERELKVNLITAQHTKISSHISSASRKTTMKGFNKNRNPINILSEI